MPNEYTDLGFRIESGADALALAKQAIREGKLVATPAGSYLAWSVGAGVRVWFPVVGSKLGHAIPDLESDCVTPLRLGDRRPSSESELVGAIESGWGEYGPVMFDVPDFRAFDDMSMPCDALVRLTAFAQGEVSAFDSEDAFYEATREELGFAAESYVSSGYMLPDGRRRIPPRAQALFFGHVLAAETRVNPATGKEFAWVRVSSLGVTIEIVADPEWMPRLPAVGGVAGGVFSLTGRPLKGGQEYRDRI